MRLIRWLTAKWPLCRKTTLNAAVAMLSRERDERFRERAKHQKDLDDRADTVCSILDRCSEIDWNRDREHYEISMRFDPRLMGGNVHELEMLAEVFGRMVQREIATARFIQKAGNNEREQRRMQNAIQPIRSER